MSAAEKISPLGDGIRLRLAGFARTLRENGFAVGHAEARDALAIMASPAATRRSTLQPALRALFCANHGDWEKFDAIFAAYWMGQRVRSVQRAGGSVTSPKALPERQLAPRTSNGAHGMADHVERREGADVALAGSGRREGASRAENIAATDIRHVIDPVETEKIHALAARLARSMHVRLVRRARARASGSRIDLRRTLRRSVEHGGTPIELVWRRRKLKPLRLVVLLDASGSMSLYTAFFVRFLHGVVGNFRESDVFLFHTRLVHISPSLKDRDIARAVERLALMTQGVGGGTEIGQSLADFNRWHARRMIHSRTAVIIVSDGYDAGTPEVLATEMRQLRRRCRRIVWLNPLLGWRDYTPQARGMKAALPHIDLFAPAHNLESLAALEPYLARI
ncbi:carbon monoxide dehydrogenase [Methylovirgula ligni]|uniref:Uncharacterized protein with von Willebrand factor type A (VWA) domain n=1 Tax=Methylovirgula ligni TaxID=569860 RepID=A0A3D9Z4C4_9HYPH|nr:VWA domain-containing protein [Methylovirgula ligni]QAY95515.1 carbon monoxide dehydrogenase [Methylovirgula ligni]REF89148.1 uncharacterized protein with von Willebrand factor type A (vWA) domain [Methylovirgula ligni]